ncbi:MAG: FecR domain-containing protein [Proteobacteria bacterium]|nr:FecR domain-containing protein [Pseudomonadota bacterium]
MKGFKNKAIYTILFLLILVPSPMYAGNQAISVEIGSGKALVVLLEGSATRIKKKMTAAEPLSKGDFLSVGDRVETGKNSRIELKLPDGSYARYDEATTFELISAGFDTSQKQRDINISMIMGKTWAKVARLFGRRGNFSISTRTAVAGVRGTIYRLNVNEDNSVTVKVYWGEVLVNRQTSAQPAVQPGMTQPTPVAGPHPVPGPHPVSMEEWTYIVGALQQIDIRPDGTATKPFRFNIQEDLNDWVRWNQQRDKAIGDI